MKLFLISTFDILEDGTQPVFIACDEESQPRIISFNEIDLKTQDIVVFNAPLIIDYLRKAQIEMPRGIDDIFQMFKLARGTSKKYHKLSESYALFIVLSELLGKTEGLKGLVDLLNSSKKIIEAKSESSLFPVLESLRIAYFMLTEEFRGKGESQRYETVERPFNYILAKRQYSGIFVDKKILNERINLVSREVDILNKRIRYEYNIFSPQNINEIRDALKKNNFGYLSKMVKSVSNKAFWSFVKTGSEQNEFLKTIYDAYRLSFDKRNLMRIIVNDDGVIYPVFDCCGTITSRTQVRMPHIQHMKKTSRDIIQAKKGFSLLYSDYSQFEPGILASLADDKKLIECYNQGDLYASLSLELFGDPNSRSLCKIIFLCFMYGMSNVGLESLMEDFFRNSNAARMENVQLFFEKFTSLVPYKEQLQAMAFKEGKIGTVMGNHRYFRNKSERLPNRVKRWVLSQKIQGTASLILKTAIMNCCKDENIQFLIPMHDAALFQVPAELAQEKKDVIRVEFENAMLKYCPNLKPKVLFKMFTE